MISGVIWYCNPMRGVTLPQLPAAVRVLRALSEGRLMSLIVLRLKSLLSRMPESSDSLSVILKVVST